LVLQADRRNLPKRGEEGTGAPESLVGRIDPKSMGSRVSRTKADTAARRQAAEKQRDPMAPSTRRRAAGPGGPRDVLAATDDIENLRYRPRTTETRETYDLLLGQVYEILDAPPDTIRSAADLMLEHLKDDSLKDFDKKKAVERIFDQTLVRLPVLLLPEAPR
jgi:pre-mRNA-splicing helicase BRR2